MYVSAIIGVVLGVLYTAYLYFFPATPVPVEKRPTPIAVVLENRKEILNLSSRELIGVPSDVFSYTNLTRLDLSHNKLSGSLPAEIRHLDHLEYLDLSDNQFTGVPAEIGQLAELRELDLSYNPITGLPYELGNLSKLEVLDLRGTNYSKIDLEKIREQLPKTTTIRTD